MDDKNYSVVAEGISKCYKIYTGPKQKLLDLILPKGAGKEFFALKDVSFKVKQGDVVGIIGLNGSGKSTLSNIIGGVSMPTKGKIDIEGEASLIAIGLGLNNFLTGIENIELKSIMMGYKKDDIDRIAQDIIDFADLGDFITQPIRTYSSGMRSRLGFAISVYTNPDILVIDEALSVGDPTFTQKCLNKMNEFKNSGKTIFFVSHSVSQIKQFCNKALWLEYGALREYGDVETVIPKYENYIKYINGFTDKEKKEYKKLVLKSQEHALLKEFKVIDSKFKKIKLRGKILKHSYLINRDDEVKCLLMNIDIFTILLGPFIAIARKQFAIVFYMIIAILLNFFIIEKPWNLIGMNIINIIFSLFTARVYANSLIEQKGYLDYDIWVKKGQDIYNSQFETMKNKISLKNSEIVTKRLIMISIGLWIIINIVLFMYII